MEHDQGDLPEGEETTDGQKVDQGSYEVLRNRLLEQGRELGQKTDTLNTRRKEVFGGTELTVIGNERVRTENNCVPIDLVSLGKWLIFGYRVFIGLKSETSVSDVFSLHHFVEKEDGFEFANVALEDAGGFLANPTFVAELKELYQYYKEARLQQLRRLDNKLLAVFQIGASPLDIKVFRWNLEHRGPPTYIDNRGERDHVFPPSHDFEWIATTRENHVLGRHPHVSIHDEVFVETVGGDLTIKVEDNTEDGMGIYREPVEDKNQALDDAQILYARVGGLVLLKMLPFREEQWRYFVFNKRTAHAERIDAIGQACVQLPEDHGIIFPGGYYLQTGERKLFDSNSDGLEFQRLVRSPNGEDVLYVFLRRQEGYFVLLPYNVIRKEVQNPIHCHGYSLFQDGKMALFRITSEEATRVHPLQIWQTPFTSAEYEAATSSADNSYLAKVGNADLVRGISDAYSIRRLIESQSPTRQTYEDLVNFLTHIVDAYYWLDHQEVGDLLTTLQAIRKTAEQVIDEFEKVIAIRQRADQALDEARGQQEQLLSQHKPEDLASVEAFMIALTALRSQRGRLISLHEMRYMDLDQVQSLEQQVLESFDQISAACVEFLLTDEALLPLTGKLEQVLAAIETVEKRTEIEPLLNQLEELSSGLDVLSEIAGGLQIEDATARTRILEGISEVFAQLNRVRATLEVRRKELISREGKAEFAAQFKLLSQSVDSALAQATTPESCDDQLSRLMLQLEEIESHFSEFDEFIAELASKREEIYDAFSTRKQTLLEEKQRRAQNLFTAATRILDGVKRRTRTFKDEQQLNTYFSSDPMLLKLRELIERLQELGDSVKADELDSRLKSSRQDARRLLRDRSELFEEGATVIKLGRHRFSVNTQPLELTMLPHEEGMRFHPTGTDFYQPVDDPAFETTHEFWDQTLVSESKDVYRGEFLAAAMLFDAERQRGGLSLKALGEAQITDGGLLGLVRHYIADRYDEGYERGVHDSDAVLILEKLLALRATAGLLRFAPGPRALACIFWPHWEDERQRYLFSCQAQTLGRLRAAFRHSEAIDQLGQQIGETIAEFAKQVGLETNKEECLTSGAYLVEELMLSEGPSFTTSSDAIALRDALFSYLDSYGKRTDLESDLQSLTGNPGESFAVANAWLQAFVESTDDSAVAKIKHSRLEAAAVLITEGLIDRRVTSALAGVEVEGILGQHPRIEGGRLPLRLDEFLDRLSYYHHHQVPRYRAYRKQRHELLERQREGLRLDEFKPRVLTSFVRNKLINEVYLPLIGDNLAKQLGSVGDSKRTDLMGMLLLVSPPGYGKTTLMEYMASQLGLVFMKVNGPSLGHNVTSLDPGEASSATARQEVNKINLALEMGNNVMLYLDDIQHTSSELLQKFISLCDAQRRIEGVWNGRTRTYDLRGKKFCMVMAGNPYTESGDRFQIPDMLANRADTYNLGDILQGKDHLFALSYLENALTSNPSLAPLAGRAPEDVFLFIRMARGEEVPATDLSYPYSATEINDIVAVLKHLFRAQEVLLKVNQQYITSAAQDDAYRTEPPFQLQGSYRNMNKLAEKIVPAMNEEEINALIEDHYIGEAQTLTSGAEQNLLKLAELRGTQTREQASRWNEIKASFTRLKRMGGAEDDPAVRVVAQLTDIGERLDAIRQGLFTAVDKINHKSPQDGAMQQLIQRLDTGLAKLQRPQLDVDVDVKASLPPGFSDLLDQQVAMVERVLMPMVRTVTRSVEEGDSVRMQLIALLDDVKRIDQRLRQASPEELQHLNQQIGKQQK